MLSPQRASPIQDTDVSFDNQNFNMRDVKDSVADSKVVQTVSTFKNLNTFQASSVSEEALANDDKFAKELLHDSIRLKPENLWRANCKPRDTTRGIIGNQPFFSDDTFSVLEASVMMKIFIEMTDKKNGRALILSWKESDF